jgi:hypothetical protein
MSCVRVVIAVIRFPAYGHRSKRLPLVSAIAWRDTVAPKPVADSV